MVHTGPPHPSLSGIHWASSRNSYLLWYLPIYLVLHTWFNFPVRVTTRHYSGMVARLEEKTQVVPGDAAGAAGRSDGSTTPRPGPGRGRAGSPQSIALLPRICIPDPQRPLRSPRIPCSFDGILASLCCMYIVSTKVPKVCNTLLAPRHPYPVHAVINLFPRPSLWATRAAGSIDHRNPLLAQLLSWHDWIPI